MQKDHTSKGETKAERPDWRLLIYWSVENMNHTEELTGTC